MMTGSGSIGSRADIAGRRPRSRLLKVNAPGSIGKDTKYKTFWVQGCGKDPCAVCVRCPVSVRPGSAGGYRPYARPA
jgi:hypothetical protein